MLIVLLVAVPVLLLLAFEGSARLANLGGPTPLWKVVLNRPPAQGDPAGTVEQRIYEVDPGALTPFFQGGLSQPAPQQQGTIRIERVRMPKPKGLRRIALVGESSVEGFPYPRNLTASAFLEAMLQVHYPAQRVEVLNLGVTAAASFPVREVARQTLRTLDPDLLVIYTGHNEFYGAFGVASMRTGGRGLVMQRLIHGVRQTASYQGLMRLLAPAATQSTTPPGEREQLIETMAADDFVEPGGALHRQATANFSANLRAMVRNAQAAGVPVVLATLASNERDMAPVRAWAAMPEQADAVTSAAMRLLRDPGMNGESAAAPLAELRAQAPKHALVQWVEGRLLDRSGRTTEALACYRAARDLDAMPWRAPSAINEAIRALARAENLPLADAEAAFAAKAGGAVGWNLMIDHLHPNLDGQYVLAHALAATIMERELLGKPQATPPPFEAPRLIELLGGNRLERAVVYGIMSKLFERPPLNRNNADVADWMRARMRSELGTLDPIEQQAIEAWNKLQGQGPKAPSISYLAGLTAMQARQYARAASYFAAARGTLVPYGLTRTNAEYLALLCLRQQGPLGPPQRQLVARLLNDLPIIERLVEPRDAAQLQATLAGVNILAGRLDEGRRRLKSSMDAGYQLAPIEMEMLQHVLLEEDRSLGGEAPQ